MQMETYRPQRRVYSKNTRNSTVEMPTRGEVRVRENDSTYLLDSQLPDALFAWVIAWVVASLAHGLGGHLQAYWYQVQPR
jgi:hypothetical protein